MHATTKNGVNGNGDAGLPPLPKRGPGFPKGNPNRGGSPRKLTPHFIARVKSLSAKGLNQHQIATALNVGDSTFSIWKRGRNTNEQKFLKALKAGEVQGLERRLTRIEKHAAKSPQPDMWWIERKFPDQWGRRDQVRLGDPDGNPLKSSMTVIAPQVVFVLPGKDARPELEVTDVKEVTNGNGGLCVEKDAAP